jgi:hypothetical protein
MDPAALVQSVGDDITKLDVRLQSGNPPAGTAAWQTLYAQRKHLDDQQRELVQQVFNQNDATYQAITGTLSAATDELNKEIATTQRVDKIINIVSQISAGVDQLLKAIP